jgi:hypothetical protein
MSPSFWRTSALVDGGITRIGMYQSGWPLAYFDLICASLSPTSGARLRSIAASSRICPGTTPTSKPSPNVASSEPSRAMMRPRVGVRRVMRTSRSPESPGTIVSVVQSTFQLRSGWRTSASGIGRTNGSTRVVA